MLAKINKNKIKNNSMNITVDDRYLFYVVK